MGKIFFLIIILFSRDLLAKNLSQRNLKKILVEILQLRNGGKTGPINFSAILKSRDFNPALRRLNFNIKNVTTTKIRGLGPTDFKANDTLKNLIFENLNCNRCNFEFVSLENSTFKNVTFKNSKLENAIFRKSKLQEVIFKKSDLSHAMFFNAKITNSKFENSNLSYANFFRASIQKSIYQSSKMKGTVFLNAQVKASKVSGANLIDTLFFNSKRGFQIAGTPKITKPIVGMMWDTHRVGITTPKVYTQLIKHGMNPIRFEWYLDQVNKDKLTKEINQAIGLVKKDKNFISIPHSIIQMAKQYPQKFREMSKIISRARLIAQNTDSFILPGGADVHPAFYGQPKAKANPEKDRLRDLLEFAILNEARLRGIPLQGICRGAQMGNVFYGGTIRPVKNQHLKVYRFAAKPVEGGKAVGLLRGTLGDKRIRTMNMHRQAAAKVAGDLEVVMSGTSKIGNNEEIIIPKAMVTKAGAPIVFLQFHPEFAGDELNFTSFIMDRVLSNENDEFWKIIRDTAKARSNKKSMHEELKMKFR